MTRAGGRGWGFLHGHLRDQPLQVGDTLHLELVPIVQGYSARLMRPAVIGATTEAQRHDAARIVAVQDRQIAAMRPGAIGRDVDAICRAGLMESGLRESYDNPTGYTLGYYHFSTPRTSDFTRVFNPSADWRLEAGMVFHMYASARGMAFSETVLVTSSGPERLTRMERKMIEC
ncbi:MAG: aminopeptidase P family protein [Alphaproteobacteria bacterium]|nr:aminopeptidase P family protein [Alphaproteobacteria bacterium]